MDNSAYTALSEQSFRIDGREIKVALGDTIDDIIEKINNASLEVRAHKVGQDNISLHTTAPHQIWLEDVGSSTVLKDIGLLSYEPLAAPNNYAETARLSGFKRF